MAVMTNAAGYAKKEQDHSRHMQGTSTNKAATEATSKAATMVTTWSPAEAAKAGAE